ncbi:hypothetical protein [Ralstonia pseudosolanacearum]
METNKTNKQYPTKEYMINKLQEMISRPYAYKGGRSPETINQFKELNANGDFFFMTQLVKMFPKGLARSLFIEPELSIPNMFRRHGPPHRVFHIEEVIQHAIAYSTEVQLQFCPEHVAERIRSGMDESK